MKPRVLYTAFILLSVVAIHAQGTDALLFDQFEQRFLLLDSLIFRPAAAASRDATIADRTKMPTTYLAGLGEEENRRIDSLIDKKVHAQVKAMRADLGLSLQGQVYGRLDDELGFDDEEAISRYTGKVQAEVRWNFLGSSFYHREGKTNEIRLRGEVERATRERANLGILIAKQKDYFHVKYDSLLSGILAHRIDNLALLADAQHYLLDEGALSSDELLAILNEKAEAERAFATITAPAAPADDLSGPEGIIVRVDSARLLRLVRENNIDLSVLELRRQLLDQQRENTTYLSTVNVSPFARYSYYTRTDWNNSANVDVGVSFIIPLSTEAGRKRRALAAERDLLSLEKGQLTEQIMDDVRLHLLDIDRMNRSIQGEFNRMGELKVYLLARRDAYDNRIGEYSFLSRLKEYNTYLSCWERLLSYQYQRDCHLASLQAFLPDVFILEFCVESVL